MFSPFEDYFILSICGLIELITSSNTSFYGSDGFHTAQHATLCICEQAEAFHIRIVPVLDDLNV
jgi:hypothetical protein